VTAEVVAAVLVGAMAQTTAGMGFALICGPVLISSAGAGHGLRLVLTLCLLANLLVLAGRGRHALVRQGLLLAVPAVAVAAPVVWAVHRLDHATLAVVAGAVTVVCAGALAARLRLPWLTGVRGGFVASLVSEVGNAIGGLSGPAVALYAVNADWPADALVPTLQVFGAVTNVVTLALDGGPYLTWTATVAMAVGWIAGSLVASRLAPGRLRGLVLLLAGAGGAYAIGKGLLS
jgi:hypothetical protein